MQQIQSKIKQAVSKVPSLQGTLDDSERKYLRGLSNYSLEVNKELEKMGFDRVLQNRINHVVGGFSRNASIEIASRRLIKKYQDLEA